MNKIILITSLLMFLSSCAIGGKGGRDGGAANVDIGPIDTCVGTTVECDRSSGG